MFRRVRWLSGATLVLLQLLPAVAWGQQRSYAVTWLGIPVVDVGVSVSENANGTNATYSAITRSWFNSVYSVDNRYEIHLPKGEATPSSYHKWIVEKGHRDSLSASYRPEEGEAVYSNGIVREWREGDHNFFSALVWLERRHWQAGERHVLPIEIEGVTWEVLVECLEVVAVDGTPSEYLLQVTFTKVIRGAPVLSSTDMLTHMLPGVGHKLKLSLDSKKLQILWIKVGRIPFVVYARLNEENI